MPKLILFQHANAPLFLLTKTRVTKATLLFATLTFLAFLLIAPAQCLESARQGSMLWYNIVFPALLPFFICINLLHEIGFPKIISRCFEPLMRPLFKLPGCAAYALIGGIIGGYPLGAKITADCKQQRLITNAEAEKLLAFTNNAGPLFLLGAVATGIFRNYQIGILLLCIHILSSITVGLLIRNHGIQKVTCKQHTHDNKNTKNNSKNTNTQNNENGHKHEYARNNASNYNAMQRNVLTPLPQLDQSPTIDVPQKTITQMITDSVSNALLPILTIGIYITFFSVLIAFLSYLGIISAIATMICALPFMSAADVGYIQCFVLGAVEMTTGLHALQCFISENLILSISTASFILGFGGFCVHMQVMHIAALQKIKTSLYLRAKLMHGLIAFIYTWIYFYLDRV